MLITYNPNAAAPTPENIPKVEDGRDDCHITVHGACVHPSDGVWVECSDCQNWSHCQCVGLPENVKTTS